MRAVRSTVIVSLLILVVACRESDGGGDDDTRTVLSGGESGTVFDASSNAFKGVLPGLAESDLPRHLAGDGVFESLFVTAPATVNGGLGPFFNNTGCANCHLREGRGEPQIGAGPSGSQMLVMLSLPSGESRVPGGQVPVPGLGLQVRDQAVFGSVPPAAVGLVWEDMPEESYGDGTPFRLRRPAANIVRSDGVALPSDVQVSLRQPLPVFGLGLLEAIPEADIRAMAERQDKVGGRVNDVWSTVEGRVVLGRFGRKAGVPSIVEQAGKAFALDVGITNDFFVGDGESTDTAPELSTELVADGAFYLRTLGVPARRDIDDPTVLRGEKLFREIGCTGCHVETWRTGDHEVSALAHQTIHPYSDLLLHDMGDGLADGRPEFGATGREWRTPALWGIGLATTVLPHATYLHDGRARSIPEAILWHGGQAAGRREAFRLMPAADRDALVRFLRSL